MTPAGKEKLFPARQRCKTCSKGLGLRAQDPVYLGLYCAPGCAGMAAPAVRPEDAPRGCRTQRERTWVFKHRYPSEPAGTCTNMPDSMSRAWMEVGGTGPDGPLSMEVSRLAGEPRHPHGRQRRLTT